MRDFRSTHWNRSELGLSIFQWPGLHHVSECASWSAPFANALA